MPIIVAIQNAGSIRIGLKYSGKLFEKARKCGLGLRSEYHRPEGIRYGRHDDEAFAESLRLRDGILLIFGAVQEWQGPGRLQATQLSLYLLVS